MEACRKLSRTVVSSAPPCSERGMCVTHPVRTDPAQLCGQGRVVLDKDVGDSGEEALHDNPQTGSVARSVVCGRTFPKVRMRTRL